ncbi:MAG: hypothetical protein HN348_04510 [Proteobacteria bacterium]|jgi:hypothetical protein|nr:hypothetical protein [Pseudomonadota bacterium]
MHRWISGLVCLGIGACGDSGDSLDLSVQRAHSLMSEGLFRESDGELLRALESHPEASAELSLRRTLLAARHGDIESVGLNARASNTSAGDLFAAEVLLVDLQTEEAKRLFHRAVEQGQGSVQITAEHYLQWLDSDDSSMAALAEVTALWALGDWATACDEAEEVVKGLRDEELRRSKSLLWASRAVAARRPDVAQGLLDDMGTPPLGQAWRFQAIQAMIWLADGRIDESRDRLDQLRVEHPVEVEDALVTACLTTEEPAIGEELIRGIDSIEADLCRVHHGVKDGEGAAIAAQLSCVTGWSGCAGGGDADLRLDWYQLYPRPTLSPFHEWPTVEPETPLPIPEQVQEAALVKQVEPVGTFIQAKGLLPETPEIDGPEAVRPEAVRPEGFTRPGADMQQETVWVPAEKKVEGLCHDLFALEARALLGKLSMDQNACLEMRLKTAPTMTEKGKVSRLEMVNAYTSDRAEWARLVKRHLEEFDSSDPDLSLKYALYLSQKGPSRATEVVFWAERALERRSVWSGDNYKSRVNTLYKLRAAAGQSMWKAASDEYAATHSNVVKERMENHRTNTKVWAREWLEYARATGRDTTTAARLCRSAAAHSEYCPAG